MQTVWLSLAERLNWTGLAYNINFGISITIDRVIIDNDRACVSGILCDRYGRIHLVKSLFYMGLGLFRAASSAFILLSREAMV